MAFDSWFRRNQKKVYIVMIFAMGAWGIGSSAIYLIPQKAIGMVAGEKITRDQLADFETRWRRILLSQLQGPVLDLVWKQLVYDRAANRSGIIVTDSDIAEGIQDLSSRIFGGRPNIAGENLIRILCSNFNVNRSQLVRTIEEVMRIHKLDYFLRSSVKVTTEELWQRYSLENEKVKIRYVSFHAEDFVDNIEVSDNEIEAFYQKYSNDFPDELTGSFGYKEQEKVKIEYVMANYDKLEKRINVTDDEVLKYYEENKEVEFKENIKVKPVDNEDDSNNSDSLTGNKITDETNNSEPPQFRPYKAVKVLIKEKLQRKKAEDLANELIAKVDEEIYDNIDKFEKITFEELAKKYDLIYNIPKSPNKDTAFITKKESEVVLIGSDRFASIAFDREKLDPSPPLNAIDGKYIFQVIDNQSPTTPPLSEIYEIVKSDLKLEMAFRKTRELSEQCLNKMKETSFKDGLDSFAAETGFKSSESGETEYISRPTFVDNRPYGYIASMKTYRPNIVLKAFQLKDKEIALAVEDEGKKASYLITLVDKKVITREEFDEKAEQVRKKYIIEKQRFTLSKWEKSITKESHLDI
ncbi:MAG: hypothetical protein ACUZ8O_01010 [Candidatus Anammoxibacter sp.]